MQDITIVGGGPAGLSAAINARKRNNSATVISNDRAKSALSKAPLVDNYPGLPGLSGSELLDKLAAHAADAGADMVAGKVSTILPAGGVFQIGYGTEIVASKSVILATGIAQASLFPGEEALLGRGVSYCATCDGMLYRGKKVCVVCHAPEAEDEADYLASIGCDVVRLTTRSLSINGGDAVSSVTADGEEIECAGVFILRPAVAPHLLLPGIETRGGHILAAPAGETSVQGVFAAGDCTGAPYQIAKAVGQGQVAALSASEYIARQAASATTSRKE